MRCQVKLTMPSDFPAVFDLDDLEDWKGMKS